MRQEQKQNNEKNIFLVFFKKKNLF